MEQGLPDVLFAEPAGRECVGVLTGVREYPVQVPSGEVAGMVPPAQQKKTDAVGAQVSEEPENGFVTDQLVRREVPGT